MEKQLYGRLTTLRKLQAVRDDPTKHEFRRIQAHQSILKIVAQLKDRKLMALRERLIRATAAGDKKWQWKIENLIHDYEKQHEGIELSE